VLSLHSTAWVLKFKPGYEVRNWVENDLWNQTVTNPVPRILQSKRFKISSERDSNISNWRHYVRANVYIQITGSQDVDFIWPHPTAARQGLDSPAGARSPLLRVNNSPIWFTMLLPDLRRAAKFSTVPLNFSYLHTYVHTSHSAYIVDAFSLGTGWPDVFDPIWSPC
jgi:hypothetical protein